MGKRLTSINIELDSGLYAGTLIDCVIPSGAAFQAERGISRESTLCSSVTDSMTLTALNKNDAAAKTVLRLHHDQRTQVRRPIHRHHGQPDTSRLAAQEQADTRFYQSLQLDTTRLLRMLRLSRCRYQSREGNQRLAAQQEDKAHRIGESEMGDLPKDWGNEFKPEPAAADRREIPRPAGENAGLRDDATETELKVD